MSCVLASLQQVQVEAGHSCLWKNPSFLSIVLLFTFSKEIFKIFALGETKCIFHANLQILLDHLGNNSLSLFSLE